MSSAFAQVASLLPQIISQRGPEDLPPEAALAIGGIILVAVVVGLLIGLAMLGVVVYVLYRCGSAIPAEYRQVEPSHAFFLLIPCFPLVWNFIFYPKLCKSFQAFFRAHNRLEFGDCGEQMCLYYSIAVACSIIPVVNYLTGPASLVLLIVNLVKFWELKKQVEQTSTGGGGQFYSPPPMQQPGNFQPPKP